MELNLNQRTILEGRYLARDEAGNLIETPADLFWRVARGVAAAEANFGAGKAEVDAWAERFYALMASFDFLPNSPTLINCGRPLGQLAACFVVPVGDSIEEIFDALKYTAIIHKSGGGAGIDFSPIRPKGSLVRSTCGQASGPVSFMRVFNAAAEEVKQGGVRWGANMGILRADHPDIYDFIACKEDRGAFRNFNISVAAPDRFFQAVENGSNWPLCFGGKALREAPARELFAAIACSAHATGEPGLLLLDAVNRANPTPALGTISATNPCVTGGAWVAAKEGPRQVSELVGRSFEAVVNGKTYKTGPVGFFKTGRKPVIRLRTREGYTVRLTADHQVLCVVGKTRDRIGQEWVSAGELKAGDQVVLHNHRSQAGWPGILTEGEGYLPGLAERMGMYSGNKTVTPEVERISREGYCGFLRGLFDADGTIIGDQKKGVSIRLAQSNYDLLSAVQRMLLRLGIVSAIYEERRPSGTTLLLDGKGSRKEDQIKTQHELVISKDNIPVFAERIGFGNSEKASKLKKIPGNYLHSLNREHYTATIIAVEEDGIEDVFDVQVPGINAIDANGFYVHNCGEQPLLPYESCNLGSINLSRMIMRAAIDWNHLGAVVELAVRFLDDVIEVNRFPLPQIAEASRRTRKIGLGVMGWADLLFQLKIAYDSEEALMLAESAISFISQRARAASASLADQRGAFPAWRGSVYYPDLPLRHATLTTIAPTGSISALAGTSPGIEPIFALAYNHTVLEQQRLLIINRPFQRYLETDVAPDHREAVLAAVKQNGSLQGLPGVAPEAQSVFKNALEIAPEWHLRMQAAFQRHIDNAVSKTINLPGATTPEAVAEIFRQAYKLGLKGITVYCTGARSDQPLALPSACTSCSPT